MGAQPSAEYLELETAVVSLAKSLLKKQHEADDMISLARTLGHEDREQYWKGVGSECRRIAKEVKGVLER